MPESEEAKPVEQEQDTKQELSPRKRIRHRKKQVYENILKQMEFYFSDANLTKDRFLGDLVKKDPFVELETFLKFNRIRSLTQDTNDIAKAMKHSTLLELSEDRSKVKRKSPLQPYNADLRTVYVESIPVTASLEWVERVFSDYGPVAYISLPKFKNSQRIKGYAFIEFQTPEDAQRCLSTFTKMGCKLPTFMPPEELSSIKMFSIDEPEDIHVHDKEDKVVYEPPKKKKKKEKKPQKGLDLKLDHSSDSEKKADTPTDETKSITTPTEDETKSITTPTEDEKSIVPPTEELKTPDRESKDEQTSHDESKPGEDQNTPRKKKSKKRTKEKTKCSLGKNEAPKGALWGLQVLAKSEWKALRNKYLNLQRKYMKDIKIQLQNKRYQYSSIPEPAAPSVDAEPVDGGVDDWAHPPSEGQGTKPVTKLERIPGVFVKEILPEPCLDVRLTKRTIRNNIHALHVDVKEGQTDVIIRFDSANAANEYCGRSGNEARALSPGSEEEQWARAEAARAAPRPRGRARLLAARAAPPRAGLAPAEPQPTHTHIRFDDE